MITINKATENKANKAQQGLHAFIKEYCQNGFTVPCFECRCLQVDDNGVEHCIIKRAIEKLNDVIYWETK